MADQPAEDFVKIVIDLPDADDGVGGEGVWSVKVGEDLYEVRNSPWHTLEINFIDIVRAVEPAEDKKPVVVEVAHRGGHRAIHVFFLKDGIDHKADVLASINQLGANYENSNGKLYALDLPPLVNFDEVAAYLQHCEDSGWLDFRYAPQPQPKGTLDMAH